MELSSPRFKAIAVSLGFTLWFYIITSALGLFSLEAFTIFVAITVTITQVFSKKLSKALDIFAIFNTKVFLGLLYISIISLYGVIFKILNIDPLRRKPDNQSYWLDMEQFKDSRILKQY